MGGSVVVCEGGSATMSTLQFVAIAEAIRLQFSEDEVEVMKEVFSPMDEGEMTFISAMELPQVEFAAFAAAVQKAHDAWQQGGQIMVGEDIWQELLDAISSDPRYLKENL